MEKNIYREALYKSLKDIKVYLYANSIKYLLLANRRRYKDQPAKIEIPEIDPKIFGASCKGEIKISVLRKIRLQLTNGPGVRGQPNSYTTSI